MEQSIRSQKRRHHTKSASLILHIRDCDARGTHRVPTTVHSLTRKALPEILERVRIAIRELAKWVGADPLRCVACIAGPRAEYLPRRTSTTGYKTIRVDSIIIRC